ncbi:hypothetical protein FEDK69T_12900 [Flavobacterium enshiense DK69]|nr:hypothetical protein FEDK69T_12900 [Flavobacterium enshiense DK69]
MELGKGCLDIFSSEFMFRIALLVCMKIVFNVPDSARDGSGKPVK